MILSAGYFEGVFVEQLHSGWRIGRTLYIGYTKRDAVRAYKKEHL
jgi:hypothetical protein